VVWGFEKGKKRKGERERKREVGMAGGSILRNPMKSYEIPRNSMKSYEIL